MSRSAVRHALLLAILSVGLLPGCATQKDPIWLDSGKVKMAEFEDKRVLVLPVEVSPSYWMEEGKRQTLQEQIRSATESAFSLNDIALVENAARIYQYPFTKPEVRTLASRYRGDAAIAVSVFEFEQKDYFNPEKIGLRIAFVDAFDPERSWAISREYVSEEGDQIGSRTYERELTTDLAAVERALRSGKGFSGIVVTTLTLGLLRLYDRLFGTEGPKLSVTTATKSADGLGRQLGGAVDTRQSIYSLEVIAEDDVGVASITVVNRAADFSASNEMEVEETGLPKIRQSSVSVPLRVGRNKVVVSAENGRSGDSERVLIVNRIQNNDVFALGVGLGRYQYMDTTDVDVNELKARFDSADQSVGGDFFFLDDNRATRRQILQGIYGMNDKVAMNEDSIGVFYFAGRVAGDDYGNYLLAYDTEPDYPGETGIRLDLLNSIKRETQAIILDFCVQNTSLQRDVREQLPTALISFDSCGEDVPSLADRIAGKMDRGASLRLALNQVFEEESISLEKSF